MPHAPGAPEPRPRNGPAIRTTNRPGSTEIIRGHNDFVARQDPEAAPRRTRIREELAALLAAALLLLALLFPRGLVDPSHYFSTDNAELYFPWLVMLGRALHHGYWPFLNPYAFAGSLPFAPLESGALYPATLLAAALTGPGWSLDAIHRVLLGLTFLHYLLGALGMYALLRRAFALGATASIWGALCYAFGGSFVGRFSHQPVLFALAWLPLAVCGTMVFVRGGGLRSAALAVLALWLMGVAAHPHFFLYGFAVVAAAAVWFALTRERGCRASGLGRGATVLTLGLGLLAPRLLPLVELSRVTVRPAPAYTIASLFDSLSPLYFLTLLAPGIFGRHVVGYWGSDHPLGNWGSLLYIGILPLLCAGLAMLHRRRRDAAFALLGLGATWVLLPGRHWAVSSWINRNLPLADLLTDLSKVTIVFHFFLALLAALGVEALLTRERRAPVAVTVAAAGGLVLAILAWLSPEIVAILAPAGRRAPSEAALGFAVESVRQARALALLALVALAAATVAPRTAKALFAPVLVLDLALSLGRYNPIEVGKGDPAVYYGGDDGTRVMERDPDVFRVAGLAPPNGGLVFRLESVWGYHTVVTRAYARLQGFLDVRCTTWPASSTSGRMETSRPRTSRRQPPACGSTGRRSRAPSSWAAAAASLTRRPWRAMRGRRPSTPHAR
jgi:hypothetical protein